MSDRGVRARRLHLNSTFEDCATPAYGEGRPVARIGRTIGLGMLRSLDSRDVAALGLVLLGETSAHNDPWSPCRITLHLCWANSGFRLRSEQQDIAVTKSKQPSTTPNPGHAAVL